MPSTTQQPPATWSVEGPILRPAAAAEYLGISISAFYAAVANGSFPFPLLKIGPRAAGVPKSFLDQLIAQRVAAACEERAITN